jgi:hypothetical protein
LFNLGCGPSVTKQPSLVVLKKIGTTDVSVTPTKTTIFGAATMVNVAKKKQRETLVAHNYTLSYASPGRLALAS